MMYAAGLYLPSEVEATVGLIGPFRDSEVRHGTEHNKVLVPFHYDSAGLVARSAAAIPSSVSACPGAVHKAAGTNVRRVRVAMSIGWEVWVLLLSFIEAGHHCTQTHYDSQEYQEPCRYPAEHTGKILVAVIKHKLPKPDHFGLSWTI